MKQKKSSLILLSAACVSFIIVLAAAPSVHAAEYSWDTSVSAGIQAGNGTWGSDAFWTTDGGVTRIAWPGATHTATFGGTGTAPFTLQLNADQAVAAGSATTGGLNFTTTGYTLQSDSTTARAINIGTGTNTRVIRVATGVEATIGEKLTVGNTTTGSGPVNVVGGGTLNVTGTGAILRQNAANSIVVNGVSGSATKLYVGTGGLVTSLGSMVIGNDAFAAELEVNGGTANSTASGGNIVIANSTGSGKVTLTDGNMTVSGTTGGIRFGNTTVNTASGELNLNGGTLTVGKVYEGNSGQTSTLNFNGGTLKVLSTATTATVASFVSGLDTASVKAGGAIIDTNNHADVVTISQNLTSGAVSDGGLTKKGLGTLALTGTGNTYNGETVVKAGTLKLNTSTTIGSSTKITVGDTGSSGTVLDATTAGLTVGSLQTLAGIGTVLATSQTVTVNGTIAPGNSAGTLTIDGGTLALTGTSKFAFELGTVSDLVTLANAATLSLGSGTLGLADFTFSDSGGFGVGTYTLIGGAASFSGTLDTGDLTGTVLGYSSTLGMSGNDVVLNVIPEPRTVLLGGFGLLALLCRRRA